MADISKLEQQADILFGNITGWENSTLQRIGKRINKYSKLSLADVKAINNIAVVKQDMDAITKELARVTGLMPFAENKELQAIVRAYEKTHNKEYLVDVANFAMLEFLYPEFADARYVPTTRNLWKAVRSDGLY